MHDLLAQIWQIKQDDPQWFDGAAYNIEKKNAKDAAAYTKLMGFKGPDNDTIKYLDDHHEGWMSAPDTFWDGHVPTIGLTSRCEPQAKIVGLYLHYRCEDL